MDMENSAIPLLDIHQKNRIFGDIPHVSDFHIPLKDRLALVEREMINSEIKRHNGNKSKAAKAMGISREALRKKLLNAEEVANNIDGKPAKKEPLKKWPNLQWLSDKSFDHEGRL